MSRYCNCNQSYTCDLHQARFDAELERKRLSELQKSTDERLTEIEVRMKELLREVRQLQHR